MYQGTFEKLELDEIARILDEVNPKLDGADFDPIETVIESYDLPFYSGYRILNIADQSTTPVIHRHVLYKPGDVKVLDWSNTPIYTLNKELPIALDDKNAPDYILFFFSHVRGKRGRFLVVENVDDIPWKEDPPPNARKAIAKMITPLTFTGQGEDGSYQFSARMMFKNALFKTDIILKTDGDVSLQNEELLIEDMPVLDDIFKQ